jgi:isoamylase
MAYDLKHRTTKTVAKGISFPLGANLTPDGVNFALYSKNATEVFLLLFDKPDAEPLISSSSITAINLSGTPWSKG